MSFPICRAALRGALRALSGLVLAVSASASEPVAPGPVGADLPLQMTLSCQQPRAGAFVSEGGTMVFTLHPGDVGRCQSDGRGARPHDAAPWMERVEVRSPYLARGSAYRLSAEVQMSADHRSAPDTSVLQLHQWHERTCACSPPLMLGFDREGRLVARLLIGQGRHQRVIVPGLTRAGFAHRWVHVAIEIDNRPGFAALALYLDGRHVLSERVLIEPEGALFLKAGLYRRGRQDGALPVDRVSVRHVRVARIEAVR